MVLELLIVESSVSFALELERICIESGFSVLGVVDHSLKALEIIYTKLPDIILMDVNILGGISGIDIGNKIMHLGIPICYFTSFGDGHSFDRVSRTNTAAYLVKPIDNYSLRSVINLLFQNCQKTIPIMSSLKKERLLFLLSRRNVS